MAKSKTKKPSKTPSKKWTLVGSKKHCPKCGKGVYMGEYKNPDRYHCGKCSYSELKNK